MVLRKPSLKVAGGETGRVATGKVRGQHQGSRGGEVEGGSSPPGGPRGKCTGLGMSHPHLVPKVPLVSLAVSGLTAFEKHWLGDNSTVSPTCGSEDTGPCRAPQHSRVKGQGVVPAAGAGDGSQGPAVAASFSGTVGPWLGDAIAQSLGP